MYYYCQYLEIALRCQKPPPILSSALKQRLIYVKQIFQLLNGQKTSTIIFKNRDSLLMANSHFFVYQQEKEITHHIVNMVLIEYI